MKKVILVMIIVVVLVISLLGNQRNRMDQGRAAIRQAAPDYLDTLHFVRCNGKRLIVNEFWEFAKTTEQS